MSASTELNSIILQDGVLLIEKPIKLSKDEARKWLEIKLAEGVNPDELRAIPD